MLPYPFHVLQITRVEGFNRALGRSILPWQAE
jgi:hypothetical protein